MANVCGYCFGNDVHDEHCPEVAKNFWDEGWKDGRNGRPPQKENPTYLLGHKIGFIVLDATDYLPPLNKVI
jgi:hypothetical protein